jgi:hypothetical protein
MPNYICKNCDGAILIMINKGQDYCSENCKKQLEAKNATRG